MRPLKIGILGFQGDIEEHEAACRAALEAEGLQGKTFLVKAPDDVNEMDALVIPGGESTVMGSLSSTNGTMEALKKRIGEGLPVLGTCAGLILLSSRSYDRVVGEIKQPLLACLDVKVERNAFGRQGESFEADVEVPAMGGTMKAVAIRAPLIKEVGPGVEVLAKAGHDILAVRQGSVVGTVFHPELSSDLSFHRHLVRQAAEWASSRGK